METCIWKLEIMDMNWVTNWIWILVRKNGHGLEIGYQNGSLNEIKKF